MNNKDIIRGIIVITITFIFLIVLTIFISLINRTNNLDRNYYIIGNDKIPSIEKVNGKRNLYKYKFYKKNNITTNLYKYKNIKNSIYDLSNYIDLLKQDYNYVYTSDIDLSKEKGNFQLSSNSIENNKIIIINVSYDKNSYNIKIDKGYGKINTYK